MFCGTTVKQLKKIGFQTDFRPCMWLVKYYAWVVYKRFERFGIKSYKFQQWIERRILANEWLIRRFIGMGTTGIATKPARDSERKKA